MNKLALFASIILVASAAYADEAQSQEKPAKKRGEWSFSFNMGQADTQNSKLTVRQPSSNSNLTYSNVKWNDKSYEGSIYYGVKATYWPSPESRIGYGFDFVHYKVFADTKRSTNVSGTLNGNPYNQNEPINNTLGRFSISHGINLATINVLFRNRIGVSENFPSGRFQPYGGIGLGIVVNHPESEFRGGPLYQKYQFGGFSWQVLGGMEYRLDKKFGIFFEYKYTDYKPTVDIENGGEATARFRTHHLAFGTTYRF